MISQAQFREGIKEVLKNCTDVFPPSMHNRRINIYAVINGKITRFYFIYILYAELKSKKDLIELFKNEGYTKALKNE